MKKILCIFLACILVFISLPVGAAAALPQDGTGEPMLPDNEIVVAVLDTGVDYTHEALASRMQMEAGSVKGYNAITKQESGFMDDSSDSHGTMAAGVIAAQTGSSGVRIMPVKVLDSNGNTTIDDMTDAINWAVDNGADIINLSAGDWLAPDSYPAALSNAISLASAEGVLVAAAAGNTGENITQGEKAYYPACLPEVLSVGSLGPGLQYSEFSNTGAKVYSLGEGIYSARIGNTYGYADGTSLAAAHVSGTAAMLCATGAISKAAFTDHSSLLEELTPVLEQNAAAVEGENNTASLAGSSGNKMALFTDERTVTGIAVSKQPYDLVYTEGEPLDLDHQKDSEDRIIQEGLIVTLYYSDDSTVDVGYEDFIYMGITAEPDDGTPMTVNDHHGKPVKVSCSGYEASTANLTVTAAPAEGASLNPPTATFDKNPVHQADVSTTLQWWNSPLTVTGVKVGEDLLGGSAYAVSGNTLTVLKGYLASQPVGILELTIEFNQGTAARFPIDIEDTTGTAPPSWPAGSTLEASGTTQTTVVLSWPTAQDDVAVTGYRIYRNNELIQTVGGEVNTFEVTGLAPSATYTFQVQAGDGNGLWTTGGPSITVTTLSPPVLYPPFWPAGSTLTASGTTHDSVCLSWTPAQDDIAVTGYGIYQDNILLQTVTDTVYVVTGLLPSTTYTFKVQAVDGEGLWTTDGPGVTVTTYPEMVPEIVELRLNAPRKNVGGSLYMGDTVELELVSTETGLHPTVTVSYEEWNSARDAVESKRESVMLTEMPSGSKSYKAAFPLREGVSRILALEAELVPDAAITKNINLAVAGRLKAAVQPPAGMDPGQADIFNNLMARSFVTVKSAAGSGVFTSQFTAGGFMVEGLDGAADYMLKHYSADYTSLFEGQPPPVKAGLETAYQYMPDFPSNVKVRVVDNITGLPLKNVAVTGKVTSFGIVKVTSAITGEDGYAATVNTYFFANAQKGSRIELTARYKTASTDMADWYADGTAAVDVTAFGDNEVVIRLKKIGMATLRGTVTDSTGAPMKQVYVSMLQSNNGPGVNVSCQTDDHGGYTMQVAKIAGDVSFNARGAEVKKPVAPADGVNTLDVVFPPPARATVNVILKTTDISGLTAKMDLNWSVAVHMNVKIKNITRDNYAWTPDGNSSSCEIEGAPGDTIEVTADGEQGGYGKGSATVVLNAANYAEATLVLKQYGRVNANVTDQFEAQRPGENRYIYLYRTDDGSLAANSSSSAAYISCHVPEGTYQAVLAWENRWYSYLSWWQEDPNCIITESFRVEDCKVVDLGPKVLNHSRGNSCYFMQNTASGFTSSHSTALPGTVVTLKAAYDYDSLAYIHPDRLDLVAHIPPGTTLVPGSVVHRVTRGGTDTAQPVVGNDSITLDLKDRTASAAGSLIYQVKVNDSVTRNKLRAGAELRFTAAGLPRSETIGAVVIGTKLITLNAPAEVAKEDVTAPVKLSGLAPANKPVELYDGDIKIGEAAAAATGVWAANVTLPDRGTPIFHCITAKTVADGVEHADAAMVLVGIDGVVITEIALTQGSRTVSFDPRKGEAEFPFVIIPSEGDFLISVTFNQGDRVNSVKVSGYSAIRQGNEFRAHIPYAVPDITVDYNEETLQIEDILKYDHGEVPPYIRNASAALVNGTASDIRLEYGADGYIRNFSIPEVKLTMLDGSVTTRMKLEPVTFDTANAKNRTHLGDGLYGYDFSYEVINGKCVITAYLDRRLLQKPAGYQANRQTTLHAANAGLEAVKAVIEVVSEGEELMGAFGDLEKTGKMAQLLLKYERVRPNLQPHLAEYYDRQLEMMGEDILMGKSLGMIGESVGEAGNLVPLLGQVVIGVAGYISGKLLGDMFDNEFESDYGRLMAQLSSLPGGQDPEEEGSEYEPEDYSYREQYNDSYWYWYWYTYQRDKWYKYDNESGTYRRSGKKTVRPRYIMDPSGFVYEAVEDNRIQGVTATALYLPKEEAADAAAAKASEQWQVWDAGWYLQQNPQSTDADGRYAWDVPEGWWMVQFVKDGYLTAYSDALPVPPPQVDINVPMAALKTPAVEMTVWGSGGRYVDIYFNKYMDSNAFGASNAISLADSEGRPVPGAVASAVPAKSDVNGLSLTKIVRFWPDAALTEGERYTLTVNKAVADYAGFSMADDYTETKTVPAAAIIGSLTGTDLTVEPLRDITQDVSGALTFTAAEPAAQGLLDKRLVFESSNANVVKISDSGVISSLAEGTAQITATSVDDTGKTAVFTITVAYPPAPVGVTRMTILDASGKALTDISLRLGDTYTLNPNVFPSNATNKTVTYRSDNSQVATVGQSGVIEAVSEGIAAITVRTGNPEIRQKIFVTVLPKQPANGGSSGGSGIPAVAAPAASIAGGEVAKGAKVALSTATVGASIHYTLDGSTPTDKSSLYSQPIVIDKATTIKAIAVKSGMKNSDVMTVSYTVKEESPGTAFELKFTDVTERDWFYEAVCFIAEKGITKGVSETEYAPHKTVTRAEFITMLCRAFGVGERTGDNFADAGSKWYTGFLAAAKQLGIAKGVGNNRFEPEREITREEMVVLIYNYIRSIGGITDIEGSLSYTDKDRISGWALEAVTYASAKGWVKGNGSNGFNPGGNATRAELAQIFLNYFKSADTD